MREIERFTVRAADGRTWRFALMEDTNTFRPLRGQVEHVPGPPQYVSLDDPDRYYINKIAGASFELVDFRPGAENVEVKRI